MEQHNFDYVSLKFHNLVDATIFPASLFALALCRWWSRAPGPTEPGGGRWGIYPLQILAVPKSKTFPSKRHSNFLDPWLFRFLDPPTALQGALRAPKHQCHPWSTRLICLNWLLDFFFKFVMTTPVIFFLRSALFALWSPVWLMCLHILHWIE